MSQLFVQIVIFAPSFAGFALVPSRTEMYERYRRHKTHSDCGLCDHGRIVTVIPDMDINIEAESSILRAAFIHPWYGDTAPVITTIDPMEHYRR